MDKMGMVSGVILSITLIMGSFSGIMFAISSQDTIMHAYAQTTETDQEQDIIEIQAAIAELTDLINLINIEYIDAVSGGKVIHQERYDEAVFFTTTALETFNNEKQDFQDFAAEQTLEVENDLKRTATIVQNKGDTQQVSNTLQHAKQKLNEILVSSGATIEPIDGWAHIDSINEMLDRLITAYNEGSYEEARILAREAYLDNFEIIQADIAEENKELMETIGSSMRADLVNMIDNRRPVSEIEAHVEQIKADLEEAKTVVTPEFSVAALALIMILIVVVMGRTGTMIPFRRQ
jgi:hypothetical protein